ncbi:MAG TPA: 2OG-Fe(II) oxygenase [Rhizomicrobium sp.]
MHALARNLITRDPPMPGVAVGILKDAAERGDAESSHLCAVIAAQDAQLPDKWTVALDYLQRAAEQGSEASRLQLKLLAHAGDAPLSQRNTWRRLRQRIDVTRWLQPLAGRVVFETPRIVCVDNFAPVEICDWLSGVGQPRLQTAEVYDPITGERLYNAAIRNHSTVSFDVTQYDAIMLVMRARAAALAGVPVDDLEPAMLLNYRPGQHLMPHFDYLDPVRLKEHIAQHGQRVGTFLLYLSDDFKGGETDFPELGWRYKGRKGNALLFWSADANGALQRSTIHAGLPLSSGEKWVFSQWIRRKS